jgi:hypothetical protein
MVTLVFLVLAVAVAVVQHIIKTPHLHLLGAAVVLGY